MAFRQTHLIGPLLGAGLLLQACSKVTCLLGNGAAGTNSLQPQTIYALLRIKDSFFHKSAKTRERRSYARLNSWRDIAHNCFLQFFVKFLLIFRMMAGGEHGNILHTEIKTKKPKSCFTLSFPRRHTQFASHYRGMATMSVGTRTGFIKKTAQKPYLFMSLNLSLKSESSRLRAVYVPIATESSKKLPSAQPVACNHPDRHTLSAKPCSKKACQSFECLFHFWKCLGACTSASWEGSCFSLRCVRARP